MPNKLNLTALVILLLGTAASAPRIQAQETSTKASLQIDEALANHGRSLWSTKGCLACHSVGRGRGSGPDLAGLLDRRDIDWVRKWLRDPPSMLQSDPIAQQLLKENNNTRMPKLNLTDDEIDSLINYVARESEKVKKKG